MYQRIRWQDLMMNHVVVEKKQTIKGKEMIEINKGTANFFYEQCTGASSGHMAMIPNSTILHSLIKAHTGSRCNVNAATKEEFADMLSVIASRLREE